MRWYAVRDASVADLAFRSHQALLHCWLSEQEGASDLARGESADGAQRERDARLHR